MRSVDLWTCDRCRDEAETERSVQPAGWARVEVIQPPRAVADPDHAQSTLLCNECQASLKRWLKERPASMVAAKKRAS